jgi:hypothetical protein
MFSRAFDRKRADGGKDRAAYELRRHFVLSRRFETEF